MRRVAQRGDRELTYQWGQPSVDAKRIWLFNQHRSLRGLGQGTPIDAESYRSFLSDTCCDTSELAMYLGEELVAISIVDVGRTSTSAVYTHFDPQASRYSLGTYAILKQIDWARETGRQFVYLGMYVAANQHLNYKARFLPQQRLSDGQWDEFQRRRPERAADFSPFAPLVVVTDLWVCGNSHQCGHYDDIRRAEIPALRENVLPSSSRCSVLPGPGVAFCGDCGSVMPMTRLE